MRIGTYHNMLGRHVNMVPNQLREDMARKIHVAMKEIGADNPVAFMMTMALMNMNTRQWRTAPNAVKTYYKTILKILKEYRDENLLAPLNITREDLLKAFHQ